MQFCLKMSNKVAKRIQHFDTTTPNIAKLNLLKVLGQPVGLCKLAFSTSAFSVFNIKSSQITVNRSSVIVRVSLFLRRTIQSQSHLFVMKTSAQVVESFSKYVQGPTEEHLLVKWAPC